ncbi:secreted frizzled-related protein 2-like [Rhineura floridana]|uniref:secreted frizzled-related protein 2-like n=1 Tax=Rhineura floridana TaxID=261503 RepID=UPI002AC86FA1|nr:secreted frizzled-related protein 2-like [Rhineura floridana]
MRLAAFILAFALRPAGGVDIGLSTKCVAIPEEMALCRDIGYSEMRLPNLMGHTGLAEVVQKSAAWHRLVSTACHPLASLFLCSLFAPVCLDTFVQPCRSMCVAVRDSCAPVSECQGHPWPSSLDCDRFPADEDTCLASLGKEYKRGLRASPKPICQTCPAIDELLTRKKVLDIFCIDNFAAKVKLSRKRSAFHVQEYNIDCQVEFINQGLLLPYDACSAIKQWFLINENCTRQMIHAHCPMVYLIVGTAEEGNVLVNQVYHWQKWDYRLTLATWKWRHRKCV